jgi:peroxiredoxin
MPAVRGEHPGQLAQPRPAAKPYVFFALIILFLGLSVALQYKIRFGESSSGRRGGLPMKTAAPDFQLKDLAGNAVALSDYRGKVVILDFWATWCLPCRNEFNELKGWVETKKKEGKWEGVEVLAVNLQEDSAVVADFVQKRKLPFVIVLDRDGATAEKYHVQALPSMLVIDPGGTIREFQEGYNPGLTFILDKLIGEIRKEKSP